MKITINVDCSPEEARTFLGLPDVRPLQEVALKHLQGQMEKAVQAMDPETVMKTFFPVNPDKFAELQKTFWGQFAKGS